MTSIPHSPEPRKRLPTDNWLAAVCIAVVAIVSFVPPSPGTCITGPSMLGLAFGTLFVEAAHVVWPFTNIAAVQFWAAACASVLIFVVPVLILYRRAPRRTYVVAILAWTAMCLFWQLLFMTPSGCPSI
jgi:hypothetical protein